MREYPYTRGWLVGTLGTSFYLSSGLTRLSVYRVRANKLLLVVVLISENPVILYVTADVDARIHTVWKSPC